MSYLTTPYAHETLAYRPTATYQTMERLITSYPYLEIRDDSTTTSISHSRTVSHTSSTTSACTDKQRCETSANTTPLTIGLSIALPVFVFALIIGVFAIRNYRKGKKEAENDDDPDFYGETTILPDYPTRSDPHYGPNTSQAGLSFPPNTQVQDSGSFYSNPFQGENNRYPANVANPHFPSGVSGQYDNVSVNNSLNQPDTKYGSYSLPYQHNMGSKQSLDAFAKQIGSEYTAYQLGTPNSRPSSRVSSRHTSRHGSPHRSLPVQDNQSFDDSIGDKKGNQGDIGSTLKISSTNEDALEHYVSNTNVHTATSGSHLDEDSFTVDSGDEEGIFKDSYADPQYSQTNLLQPEESNTHRRNISEFSYIANDPEVLHREEEKGMAKSPFQGNLNFAAQNEIVESVDPEEKFQFEKATTPSKENVQVDALNDTGDKPTGEDEDENVQRIKSVYRIYFDRENSIRSKRTTMGPIDANEEVPPLPQIDTSLVQGEEIRDDQTEQTNIGNESSQSDELPAAESSHLTVEGTNNEKSHRVVSSIYSTIPLAKFDENGQIAQPLPHQDNQQQYDQYEQQQQYGRYQLQEQYNQFYDPKYAAAQNQVPYAQYPSQPPSMNQQPYFVPQQAQPLQPAQVIPNPTKIDYDSVIGNPVYAPKKSLTTAARPQLEVKPFNPLHYSDKIFSPTSPVIPSSPSFSNSGSQFELPQQAAPSPHHIRQSIVMVDPVEIGAAKLYRPAGSFTRELHSANSSRSGSISSQSGTRGAFYNPDGSRNEVLPRAGSQMDLRKQLGSSKNYNF